MRIMWHSVYGDAHSDGVGMTAHNCAAGLTHLLSTPMAEYCPPNVLAFPVELTHHLLSEYCHPWDVAAFSATCRAAYALVYLSQDQYLWRQLYLNHFDGPQFVAHSSARNEEINWKAEVTSRLQMELALFNGPTKAAEMKRALRKLTGVIQDASITIASSPGLEQNTEWLKHIVHDSHLLSNLCSIPEPADDEDATLYSRLRAYLAPTIDDKQDKRALDLLTEKRNTSRAYVYDLRHYTAKSNWGPFLPGGAVNWVHVEHLINVVFLNVRELPGTWSHTKPPSFLDAIQSPTSLPIDRSASDINDWAGVEGTWRRYVCFMDYRDLFAFNFTDLASGPRNLKFFSDSMFREAIRLIEVKLTIIPSTQMRFHKLPEGEGDKNPNYPPLCFTGSSKGVNGNEATVEGFVVMGIDGTARWQLTSIYDHHPQWSSSGVQVGGVKSSTGIIGTWTTTHHDDDDPAGPFWLWKVDEDCPTQLMEFT